VLFILELDYSGIFEFQVDDPLMKERIVFIECPRMLFPFARRVVADVSRDGGFPPLMIDPVDFIALYQQQKARQASAQNGESNSLAAGA
ncbi:MAG: protein-export chaperone SecB, partial [Pseudomonadota bacterium]